MDFRVPGWSKMAAGGGSSAPGEPILAAVVVAVVGAVVCLAFRLVFHRILYEFWRAWGGGMWTLYW